MGGRRGRPERGAESWFVIGAVGCVLIGRLLVLGFLPVDGEASGVSEPCVGTGVAVVVFEGCDDVCHVCVGLDPSTFEIWEVDATVVAFFC